VASPFRPFFGRRRFLSRPALSSLFPYHASFRISVGPDRSPSYFPFPSSFFLLFFPPIKMAPRSPSPFSPVLHPSTSFFLLDFSISTSYSQFSSVSLSSFFSYLIDQSPFSFTTLLLFPVPPFLQQSEDGMGGRLGFMIVLCQTFPPRFG